MVESTVVKVVVITVYMVVCTVDFMRSLAKYIYKTHCPSHRVKRSVPK